MNPARRNRKTNQFVGRRRAEVDVRVPSPSERSYFRQWPATKAVRLPAGNFAFSGGRQASADSGKQRRLFIYARQAELVIVSSRCRWTYQNDFLESR